MPTFYFDTDIRAQFSAPQFTRLRHRYRGVRESWKVNLEIDQLLFSITDLYRRYNILHDNFVLAKELLIEGGAVTGVTDYDDDPMVLDGLDSLIQQVAALKARVKRLER